MGYDGVKTALAASKGEKVPAIVDTGVNLITKDNMNIAALAGAAQPEGEVGKLVGAPMRLSRAIAERRIPGRRFSSCAGSTSASPARMR